MIPIGDDRIHGARTPFVTWAMILINVLVFFYQIQLSSDPEVYEQFIYRFGATPAVVLNGLQPESLLTCIFLHGGWMHIIGNMMFLYVFGDNIEAVLGHLGFLAFYLLGGLAASLGHVLLNTSSIVPSIGASGAVSACLGAYLVMFPRSKVRLLIPIVIFLTTARVSAWVFLGIWILLQLFNGTAQPAPGEEGGGVAWWAHIAGFAFGVFTGMFFHQRAKRLLEASARKQSPFFDAWQ